jgi:hypothetical protein
MLNRSSKYKIICHLYLQQRKVLSQFSYFKELIVIRCNSIIIINLVYIFFSLLFIIIYNQVGIGLVPCHALLDHHSHAFVRIKPGN